MLVSFFGLVIDCGGGLVDVLRLVSCFVCCFWSVGGLICDWLVRFGWVDCCFGWLLIFAFGWIDCLGLH